MLSVIVHVDLMQSRVAAPEYIANHFTSCVRVMVVVECQQVRCLCIVGGRKKMNDDRNKRNEESLHYPPPSWRYSEDQGPKCPKVEERLDLCRRRAFRPYTSLTSMNVVYLPINAFL